MQVSKLTLHAALHAARKVDHLFDKHTKTCFERQPITKTTKLTQPIFIVNWRGGSKQVSLCVSYFVKVRDLFLSPWNLQRTNWQWMYCTSNICCIGTITLTSYLWRADWNLTKDYRLSSPTEMRRYPDPRFRTPSTFCASTSLQSVRTPDCPADRSGTCSVT